MIMLKIALVIVKIYVLVGKKGISKLSRWIAAKHTAFFIIGFKVVVAGSFF